MGNIYYESKRGLQDVDQIYRYEHLQLDPIDEITLEHPFDQVPSSTSFFTPDKEQPLHLVNYSFPQESNKINIRFAQPTAFFLVLKK